MALGSVKSEKLMKEVFLKRLLDINLVVDIVVLFIFIFDRS